MKNSPLSLLIKLGKYSSSIFLLFSFLCVQAQNELSEQADSCFANADYAQALEKYTEWLRNNDVMYDSTYLENLRKLARTEELLFQYENALRHFAKVEDLAKVLENKSLSYKASTNIADLFRRLGQYDKAKKQLHDLYFTPKDSVIYSRDLSRKYHRLAAISQELGQIDSAMIYSYKSLEISKKQNISGYIPISYNELGYSFEHLQKHDSALYYYQAAIQLWEDAGKIRYYTNGYFNLSRLYNKLGQPNKSIAILTNTLQQLSTKDWPNVKNGIYSNLVESFKQKGDKEKEDHFKIKALEEKVKNMSYESDQQFIRMQTEYDVAKKEQAHFMALLDLQYQKKRTNYLIIGTIMLALLIALTILYLIHTKQKNKQLDNQNLKLEHLVNTNNTLFSIISHDLRSPLNSLTGLMELLMNHMGSMTPEELKLFVEKINRQTKNVNLLLDNLLSWALTTNNQLTVHKQKVDISKLAKRNVELFSEASANKYITVEAYTLNECFIFADEKSVDTVIRNVLNNAIKFTPTGGKVEIFSHSNLHEITLTIRDNGLGIDKERVSKLFSKQINKSMKGTSGEKGSGLGLMLCKELLEKNGGQIEVESEVGKGTSFHITLPLYKEKETKRVSEAI
ncbi:tetratricopeptide repeat-containing sensor histidine kinase [Flammeovirgaceae bacterium SG7u.111]|nr:tetratricopeptide repeat-containing sensor histidine kinase [Flammeovirgaceae bacterium SG7u.132]WPO34213.1 tetratricopeptide repeat-containing sensor histidine kinase [Flammeovirgaceae bacterium SG7u.111]